MPNYLIRLSTGADYLDGVLKEGFASREAYVKELIEGLGGSLKGMYWAHGDADAYLVAWAPEVTQINAALLTANRAGQVSTSTVSLFTSEEMDQAAKILPEYRPPGT